MKKLTWVLASIGLTCNVVTVIYFSLYIHVCILISLLFLLWLGLEVYTYLYNQTYSGNFLGYNYYIVVESYACYTVYNFIIYKPFLGRDIEVGEFRCTDARNIETSILRFQNYIRNDKDRLEESYKNKLDKEQCLSCRYSNELGVCKLLDDPQTYPCMSFCSKKVKLTLHKGSPIR